MKAELLIRERLVISETAFVEMVVWRVPEPARGIAPTDFRHASRILAGLEV
jgi:hypothetical protein